MFKGSQATSGFVLQESSQSDYLERLLVSGLISLQPDIVSVTVNTWRYFQWPEPVCACRHVCVREYVYEGHIHVSVCMCTRHQYVRVHVHARVQVCTCVSSHLWLLQVEMGDGIQYPTMHKPRLPPRAVQCKLSLSRPEPLLEEQPRSLCVSVPWNQGTAHLQQTGPGWGSPCSLGVQAPHPHSSA